MAIVLFKGDAFKICDEFSYLHELDNGWSYTKGEKPKPKVETPKVETPKVETPKEKPPVVETLKVETPKVEVKSKAAAFNAKPKGDPKTVTPAPKTEPLKAESKAMIFDGDPK